MLMCAMMACREKACYVRSVMLVRALAAGRGRQSWGSAAHGDHVNGFFIDPLGRTWRLVVSGCKVCAGVEIFGGVLQGCEIAPLERIEGRWIVRRQGAADQVCCFDGKGHLIELRIFLGATYFLVDVADQLFMQRRKARVSRKLRQIGISTPHLALNRSGIDGGVGLRRFSLESRHSAFPHVGWSGSVAQCLVQEHCSPVPNSRDGRKAAELMPQSSVEHASLRYSLMAGHPLPGTGGTSITRPGEGASFQKPCFLAWYDWYDL